MVAFLKAPKHPASWYPRDQLAKGRIVEREHTDVPAVADNITKNHIDENRKYYNNPLFKEDLEKSAFWRGFCERAVT